MVRRWRDRLRRLDRLILVGVILVIVRRQIVHRFNGVRLAAAGSKFRWRIAVFCIGNSGIRSSHSRRSPNFLVVRRSTRRVASSPRAPGGSFARRARCGSSFHPTCFPFAAVKAVEAFGAPSGLVPTARWFRLPARFFGAVCWMRLFGGCELGSPELIRSGSGSRFPSGCVSVQLVHRRRTA